MTEPQGAQLHPAPPTGEQLLGHLNAHPPRAGRRWRPGILLLVGVVIGVMLFSGPSLLGIVAPWLLVIGFVVWAQMKKRQVLDLQNRLRTVRELTLLRRPAEAGRHAWHLIPDLTRFADFHVQTVMLLATNYMAQRAFDPAVTAQDYLIEHLPEAHPVNRVVRLQRLLGLLHEDRLSDADDELRKLERTQLDPIGQAMLRVARLYQQLKTHHAQDAVARIDEDGDELIDQMRCAGVNGGVGYALAAAAYLAVGRDDDARTWWRRATLLIPPAVLAADAPEIQPLLDLPPAKSLSDAMREDRR